MKKHLYKLLFLFVVLFFMTGGHIFTFGYAHAQGFSDVEPEKTIRYSKSMLNQGFDFDLQPITKGKFRISFLNDTKKSMDIRVYDIIGNLLMEETIRDNGSVNRIYDLSYYKSQFFVIEIGNARYNKTKSIIAG